MKDCLQAVPVQGMRLYYHCDQVGHVKANCTLLAAKPAQVSALATLRNSDGRPVKVEPPKDQGRAFQLIAEEARVAPDVVARMFLSFISFIISCLCISFAPMFRYVFSELLACIGFI